MKDKQSSTHVLGRALSLIDFLALYPHGISLTDTVAATGLPKTTTHRLLSGLVDAGYVQRTAEGLYSLSFKVCELSYRVLSGLDLLEIATPIVKRLCDTVSETVHLVVPSGVDIVYLRKDEPIQASIHTMSYIGMRRPMYCTAAGKSMLSLCSDEQVLDIWKKSEILKIPDNTIVQYSDLVRELEETRQRGYALDNEENEIGVKCIAGAIKNHLGSPIGAISITAPSSRMTDEKLLSFSGYIMQAVDSVSFAMGYSLKR